jgi:hypothetical protein
MEELIRFVVNYEVGIYFVLGIVLLINLKRLISAWMSIRKANFGLEREVAQKGIRSAFTFIFLVSVFGLSNFILVSVASIRYPGIAQIATPTIDLIGTVNLPNLGFYKYEYRYQGDEIWTPISAGNRPVVKEALGGTWNTEQLRPGNYFLRLVVSDNANNLIKPCEIEVKVLPE